MIQYFNPTNKLIALLLSIFCAACTADTELRDMCFVGDSLVARWDLQASFPTSIVENYGVSGSGITYLESLAGKFEGRTVVVISGTNDVAEIASSHFVSIDEYALRYISAIKNLKAATVYLYSIFPRGEQFNGQVVNPLILQLNALIEQESRAAACDIHYIDVYGSLLYKDLLNPQYSFDGLHLNEYGYAVITQALTSSI